MNGIMEGKFFNPTKGSINFDQVLREIQSYMFESTNDNYEVIVGCDSPSEKRPDFPIAIVVLRKGKGGRFFLKKTDYSILSRKEFGSWKERILEEVFLSCQLAVTLKEELTFLINDENCPEYQFEYIHADIGKNGITKSMIKEVTALIRGNGFKPKVKPEAFAASIVADRYT